MFSQSEIQFFLSGTADSDLKARLLSSLKANPDGQVGKVLERLETFATGLLETELSHFEAEAGSEQAEESREPTPRRALSSETVARVREIVREYANILAEIAPEANSARPRSLASSVLFTLAGDTPKNDFWQTVEKIVLNKFYDRLTGNMGFIPAEYDVRGAYPPEAIEEDIAEIKDTLCNRLPKLLNQPLEQIRNVVDAAFDGEAKQTSLARTSPILEQTLYKAMVMQMQTIFLAH